MPNVLTGPEDETIARRIGLLFVSALLVCLSCGEKNNAEPGSYDYRLFEDTPVSELAQAVQEQHTKEIVRITREDEIDIDYQESRFGSTLLMVAVINEHVTSCKALLESGADPNIHNAFNGATALIEAAALDNTAFLRLLLDHGADPNGVETGDRKPGNTSRLSPLLAACRDLEQDPSTLEKVTLLVEAGADVNYENEFHRFALQEALLFKHMDVVLYLLQKGADHKKIIVDRGEFQDQGKQRYIADILREHLFPLGSKAHAIKMEVVDFLKTKGIDYRKIPIPDFVLRQAKADYPANWQEYLDKY